MLLIIHNASNRGSRWWYACSQDVVLVLEVILESVIFLGQGWQKARKFEKARKCLGFFNKAQQANDASEWH